MRHRQSFRPCHAAADRAQHGVVRRGPQRCDPPPGFVVRSGKMVRLAANLFAALVRLLRRHDEFRSRLRLAWPDNKNIENNPMQSNRGAAASLMQTWTEWKVDSIKSCYVIAVHLASAGRASF